MKKMEKLVWRFIHTRTNCYTGYP